MANISSATSQKIRNMSIICAILVVTIHVGWPTDEICLTWFINELIRQGLAGIAVPLFFVISGFFLSSHFNDMGWWRTETKKRIHSLVIPFFIWGVISFLAVAPIGIVADMIAHRPFGTTLPLSSGRWIRTIGLAIDKTPGLAPLWYVRCLFFFVILSPLFKTCVEKFKLWWLAFTFAVAIVFNYLPVNFRSGPGGFFHYGLSLSGIFYFSVGIYIKRFHVSFHSIPLAVASAIYGLGCLFAKIYVHAHGHELPIGIDCLTIPALMYAIWYIMPSRKYPLWFTSCSFSIYLLHCIFLECTGTALKYCPFGKQANSIIAFVIAVVAPIVLTNLLRKISPKLADFLFAGRS